MKGTTRIIEITDDLIKSVEVVLINDVVDVLIERLRRPVEYLIIDGSYKERSSSGLFSLNLL